MFFLEHILILQYSYSESCSSMCPLVEKKRLIGHICILWETQKWLNLIKSPHWQTSQLFEFAWPQCFSHHPFSAQKKCYPGCLLEDWAVNSFTARRIFRGLAPSMVKLCQGVALQRAEMTARMAGHCPRHQGHSSTGPEQGWQKCWRWANDNQGHSAVPSQPCKSRALRQIQDCSTEPFSLVDYKIHWPEEEAEQV